MNAISLRCSLFLLCLFALTVSDVVAQTGERPRIGLVLNGGLDLHSASFRRLPELDNCCPSFTGGSGFGWLAGISYTSPVNEAWTLDIRAGYRSFAVDMLVNEAQLVSQPSGLIESARIRHELSTSFSSLVVEPLVRYQVATNLNLRLGLYGSYALGGSYSQGEYLETPSNAVFENGTRARNQAEGSLTSLSSINVGFTAGIGVDLPLSSDRSMIMSPEILATVIPTNILGETSWSMSTLRAGVVISYSPIDEKEEFSDLELFDIARNVRLEPNPTESAAVVPTVTCAALSESGNVSEQTAVRIEEYSSNRVRPLLPYVFFEQGSYTLDARYRQLSEEQVQGFSLSNFYNLDALVTYYHLLNIVGKRMTQLPDATLSITGFTDASEASSSEDLGKRRATVVRNYLTETWGISSSRISIEGRNVPSQPSNEGDADGAAENRRVELTSSSPEILAAVGSLDTMRVFNPPALRFTPRVSDSSQVRTWTLFVSDGEHIIRTFHGQGAPPSTVDWRLEEQARFVPRGVRRLEYMFVVQDSAGRVIPTEGRDIAISEVTLDDKRSGGGTDKTIDRYSMILFGFDRADLSPEHLAMLKEIKQRVTNRSTITVTGYTDRSGASEYNQRLSEQRARQVSNVLGVERTNVSGRGELLPLFDNSLPEGRFYSRTVEVLIETPVN